MNSTPITASIGSAETQTSFIAKLRGQTATLPPRASVRQIALAGIGGAVTIGLIATLAAATKNPLVLGSFGASCVLLFGFPESPFSQPRNVVFGHAMSSLIGLIALKVFGPHGWAMALAAGTAIAAMMATRTVHPPAGSNPVIVFLTQPGWSFLAFPTIVGALLLVLAAAIYLNLTGKTAYPKYWLGRGI
jgi:CBS-domain-containing membrane protein